MNSAPYLAFVTGGEQGRAACLGIMNSLPFDWQARRIVEANVNYFILEALTVPDLNDGALSEVARASASILEEHNESAMSPADGPSVGGIQQWARQLLSEPQLATSAEAADAYDVLGVERGTAVRQALGAILREFDGEEIDPIEGVRRIGEIVAFYGLSKVDPPEPLLPITEEDIGVVCWMAVLPESA